MFSLVHTFGNFLDQQSAPSGSRRAAEEEAARNAKQERLRKERKRIAAEKTGQSADSLHSLVGTRFLCLALQVGGSLFPAKNLTKKSLIFYKRF